MKTKKIVKNTIKTCVLIVAVISIFIVIVLIRKNKNQMKLNMLDENFKQTNQEEIAKNISNVEEREEITQLTSRHSSIRSKDSTNIEQTEIAENTKTILEDDNYIAIEDITISRDMDLTVRTGLSKENFKILISNVKYDTSKFFYENSDLIYDLCEEYQINEIFLCGLISAESGWNIAYNHRRTHNYISLMTKNGLIQYNSVEEGLIAAVSSLHNNYLTEGGRFYHGKTIYGVKTNFCPASTTWVELVYGRMEQIVNSK